jgi:ABC-type oligopeptide transport system substrate-binding subunit
MIGASLSDRYLLQEQIGQGGMGTVWRGFDTVLERPVAIKVLNAEGFGTEGRSRLLAEARAIARLDHPNIVAVHDAGESDGSPYIVMELVEGHDLHDRPPADLGQIVDIAGQICAALEHAHSQGIIHRDLKPENVVIGQDGVPRLMDFGLARSVASRLTQEGHIVGTVFYMAPEQALGESVDGRADLYSLGVMMYELTTGALPFTHDDPGMVISQHVHATPVPPRAKNEDIPPALNKLILALMSKDPKARPSSAAEVGRNLASPALLGMQSAQEDEPTALERIAHGRMVGREKETDRARQLWMKARGGEAQTLLISGEPGVGKSRLLRELVTHVELTGGRALGAASYQEGAVPYAGFRQILREVFRDGSVSFPAPPAAVLQDLVALLPELGAGFPGIAPRPPQDPHSDQARLFESITILLSELAQRSPLLLYLDDAHWADSGTLLLLRHLVRIIRSKSLMVAVTYREQELDQALPFNETLSDLERSGRATSVRLQPLRRDQTSELLGSIFKEEITDEFLEGIHRETEGNPFFIEEVCKALVESGRLYYRDGRWHRPAIEELGIPKNVRVAIQSRISKLPTESQEVLKQAAVLGRAFDVGTLRLATEAEEDSLLTALEDAERAQLIELSENGEGTAYLFAHGLIPSTMVEGLRVVERRRLHRRAASAVEQTYPAASARLARHYQEAGELAKGIEYLLRAGNEARLLHAHQEAIDCYRQAVDYYLESGDDRRASSVLFRLALTYHNAFDFKSSHDTYNQAFQLLQRASTTREATFAPPAPHSLRLAMHEPRTLDPTRASDAYSLNIIQQLFSGLVEGRPDGGIVPDIATSWEVSGGGTRYTFHLRPDARWSDGEPVTAADFAYAWKRCLEPGGEFVLASSLYDIRGARAYHQGELSDDTQLGVRALDDGILIVELEAPVNYFLSLLASPVSFAVPRKIVEEHGEAWAEPEYIVTSGPYRLKNWVKGEFIELERWTDHHGGFAGNAESLAILLHTGETSDLLQKYEDGHLDIVFISEWPMEQYEVARQRHASEYVSIPLLALWFVYFDFRKPPFADRRVRQAFAHAVDREALANVAMHGVFSPATGSFVPPGMPGYFAEIIHPHDPDGACKLLASAGFPEARGLSPIRVRTAGAFMMESLAHALALQWRTTLGVDITVEQLPWHDYLASLADDPPHLGIMGIGGQLADPSDFLSEPGLPELSWRNATYERLVQIARQTADMNQRMEHYLEAARILVEEVPVFPVLYIRMHFLIKPWISSFPTSPTRWSFFKDVVIDPH